jgi:ribose transport system ATP-binding protein
MDISFTLNKGEILGIAGLVGSGRTELARAIYGVDRISAGTIRLNGKNIQNAAPGRMVREGIFLAPEDRKGDGLVLTQNVRENITYSKLSQFFKFGILQGKKEMAYTNEIRRKINIRAPSVNTLCRNLSGGNQQKVVVSKALTAKPTVLIADEPTQGIDVGAKAEIYGLLNDLANDGMAVLVISSELEEVIGLCHRVLVMRNGKLVGEISQKEISNAKLILELMYRSET